MYYVYLLKSKVSGDLYVGYTHDLKKRVAEHNKSKIFHTKNRIPWEVIYYEAYKSSFDAKGREKQLKRFAQGYFSLRRRIPNCIK